MAIIDKTGKISGLVGNVVFRKYGNTDVVQAKPHKRQLNAASLETAGEFGRCSRLARLLGSAIREQCPFTDGALRGRTIASLLRCLRSSGLPRGKRSMQMARFRFMEGLEANVRSPFGQLADLSWQLTPQDGQGFTLSLDELCARNIRHPFGSIPVLIHLRLSGYSFSYEEEKPQATLLCSQNFLPGRAPERVSLAIPYAGAATATFVMASIVCYRLGNEGAANGLLNSIHYSPARIVCARNSEE